MIRTQSSRLLFFLIAAAAGGLVALATIGLIELIQFVQWLSYGQASELRFASIAASLPAWQIVLITTSGGLLVGVMLRWLPGQRYQGIADVMEACALNSARMPARSGVAAAAAAAVSLGTGAPLGREGPAVHIGASMTAWAAEWLGLDRRQSLALLGCGAAAAVTVSFNAPIAGVIFALEVIVGHYTLRVFAPVVLAALVAILVRHAVYGRDLLFELPVYGMAHGSELALFALLGVLGALVSRLLVYLVERVQATHERLRVPAWLRPAAAGLIIGIIATQLPHLLSVGIEATALALQGELVPTLLLALLVFKVITVALAIGSGFAGGVFGPAVYIGAMLGGSTWLLLSWTGLDIAQQGAYSIVGAAAVGSALLGAPISTILIVFEITRDYDITLGVMMASAVASSVMQWTGHGSFFRWQLANRNVNLAEGRDISLLTTHRVRRLVTQHFTRLPPDCSLGELEARLAAERRRLAMLVDDSGRLHGSIALSELVAEAVEQGLDHPAGAVTQSSDYSINVSTNIVTALQRMAERQLDYIPVTETGDDGAQRLVGVVEKSDLLAEHYDVIKRARNEEFGVT